MKKYILLALLLISLALSGSACTDEQLSNVGFDSSTPVREFDRYPARMEYATSTGDAGIVLAYADPHLYEDEILAATTKTTRTCHLEVPMGGTVEIRFICESCGTEEQHTLTSPSAILLHCACDRSHPCDGMEENAEPTEPTEPKDAYREYLAVIVKPEVSETG